MELGGYIRVLQRRWKIFAVTLIVVVGTAAAITLLTEPLYRATSQLYVSTVSAESPTDLAQGSTFTQNQVATYADVATTPYVLSPVIKSLDLDMSPQALAGKVTTEAPTSTVLLNISVTDPEPDLALDIAEAVSEQLVQTLAELDQVDDESASPVKATLVAPAAVGSSPVSPQPVRNILFATLLGLVLGAAVALGRDLADTSIRGEGDVRGLTEVPILGGITYDKKAAADPRIVLDNPHHSHSETFRTLRTNLQFVNAGDQPRSMVLTSSLPEEGKTTTTAHLALALAAAGKSVCVIEGDLRRPRLMQYLGMEGSVGLTNVLIGEAEIVDMLQQYGDTNLTLLGCGPIPPNPAELLGSERMKALVGELTQMFDSVIIDAPPLLPVTDSAVLAGITDGAIVVVGANIIKKEHLKGTIDRLEKAQGTVLGVILNQLPTTGDNSYYYHYSSRYAPQTESDKDAGAEERAATPVS